jgi:hypothetical protein
MDQDLDFLRKRVWDLEEKVNQLTVKLPKEHLKYTLKLESERPPLSYPCSVRYEEKRYGVYTDIYTVEDQEQLGLMILQTSLNVIKIPINYCPFCCKHPLFK